MARRYGIMMLPALLLLTLSLSGCAQNIHYLTDKAKIWIIPKGTSVKSTEGLITADDDLVAGYKGHLFQEQLDADAQAIKK